MSYGQEEVWRKEEVHVDTVDGVYTWMEGVHVDGGQGMDV